MQKKAYGTATGIDGLWCIQWFTSSQVLKRPINLLCIHVFSSQVKITESLPQYKKTAARPEI
jgi:hypothetical protein